MSEAWLHRFYRGVYLPKIAWALSKGKGDQKQHVKELHKAFSTYFSVSSTADFNNHEFLCYLSQIQMIMIRERSMMVPFLNEPDTVQEMDMKSFLELQRIIDK